jgi:hypothetical protein
MKKNVSLSLFLIFLFSFLIFSNTATAQKSEKTIKGEVVDVLTYATTGKSGTQFKEVMLESSKKGNPLGILSGGKIYIVATNDLSERPNDQLTPFLSLKVIVKGKVFSKGGVNVIILSNIDKDMKAK